MPGYHYKRKGYAYGSAPVGNPMGAQAGISQGSQQGESSGNKGDPSTDSSYGGTLSNGEGVNGGGLQSLSDVVGLYAKYSPTALAMRSLGFVRDAIEGLMGYEGTDATTPSNPNNPEGGGGGDILLAQQLQPIDPDQEYLDNITDPDQLRIIAMMQGQDYEPDEIRQYLEATSRDVGLV